MLSIFKKIGLGIGVYAVLMTAVVVFYPDSPDDMDWEDREEYNKVQIGQLELGLTKANIIERLGSPDISEAKTVDDQHYQVMFYRTQHMESDGITSMNECTPLLFIQDTLVAWGQDTYQQYLNP